MVDGPEAPTGNSRRLGGFAARPSKGVYFEQVFVHVMIGELGDGAVVPFAPGAPNVGEELEPERRGQFHAAEGGQEDFLTGVVIAGEHARNARDDVLLVDEAEGVRGLEPIVEPGKVAVAHARLAE